MSCSQFSSPRSPSPQVLVMSAGLAGRCGCRLPHQALPHRPLQHVAWAVEAIFCAVEARVLPIRLDCCRPCRLPPRLKDPVFAGSPGPLVPQTSILVDGCLHGASCPSPGAGGGGEDIMHFPPPPRHPCFPMRMICPVMAVAQYLALLGRTPTTRAHPWTRPTRPGRGGGSPHRFGPPPLTTCT